LTYPYVIPALRKEASGMNATKHREIITARYNPTESFAVTYSRVSQVLPGTLCDGEFRFAKPLKKKGVRGNPDHFCVYEPSNIYDGSSTTPHMTPSKRAFKQFVDKVSVRSSASICEWSV
jgi:hypothetical protein